MGGGVGGVTRPHLIHVGCMALLQTDRYNRETVGTLCQVVFAKGPWNDGHICRWSSPFDQRSCPETVSNCILYEVKTLLISIGYKESWHLWYKYNPFCACFLQCIKKISFFLFFFLHLSKHCALNLRSWINCCNMSLTFDLMLAFLWLLLSAWFCFNFKRLTPATSKKCRKYILNFGIVSVLLHTYYLRFTIPWPLESYTILQLNERVSLFMPLHVMLDNFYSWYTIWLTFCSIGVNSLRIFSFFVVTNHSHEFIVIVEHTVLTMFILCGVLTFEFLMIYLHRHLCANWKWFLN